MSNDPSLTLAVERRLRFWRWACLGTWLVLVAGLGFELFPRWQGLWRGTPWGKERPWSGDLPSFLQAAGEVARSDLYHPAPRFKLDPRRMDRPRTLLWVRDRVSGGLELRQGWPNAILAQALVGLGAGAETGLERYWDELLDPRGEWRQPPRLLEHCLVGMPLLDWHARSSEERHRRAALFLVEWLVEVHPRSKTGTLPYRPEQPDVLVVDTLGMVCPLLARHGARSDDPRALRLAKHQLFEFLERGMDPSSGLPFHAYQVADTNRHERLGLAGWGRGTGWLALGLAGTLQWLPPDDADRPALARAFRDLMTTVRRYQRADGLWGWAVNLPGAAPHTSATGMLAWALRMGIESGVLEREGFEADRRKAVQGILLHTTDSGRVGQSMADAAGIGQYPWLFGHTPWAQGLAILAAGDLADP